MLSDINPVVRQGRPRRRCSFGKSGSIRRRRVGGSHRNLIEPSEVRLLSGAIDSRDMREEALMKKYQCIVCGFIYDESEGLPSEGLEPGTRWDDVPDDWMCPECGVGKADFDMVEM